MTKHKEVVSDGLRRIVYMNVLGILLGIVLWMTDSVPWWGSVLIWFVCVALVVLANVLTDDREDKR